MLMGIAQQHQSIKTSLVNVNIFTTLVLRANQKYTSTLTAHNSSSSSFSSFQLLALYPQVHVG